MSTDPACDPYGRDQIVRPDAVLLCADDRRLPDRSTPSLSFRLARTFGGSNTDPDIENEGGTR